MDNNAKYIVDWRDDSAPRFTQISDAVWDHPEGFAIRRDIAGINTNVGAKWGSGSPAVGFLVEYDALTDWSQKNQPEQQPIVYGAPERGCGHNPLDTDSLRSSSPVGKSLCPYY